MLFTDQYGDGLVPARLGSDMALLAPLEASRGALGPDDPAGIFGGGSPPRLPGTFRLSDELEQLCGEPPAAGPGGLSQLMTAATCSMRLALPPPLIGTNLPALLQSSGLVAGLPNHNMLPQPPALQLPPLDCELLCNYDFVASSLGDLGDACSITPRKPAPRQEEEEEASPPLLPRTALAPSCSPPAMLAAPPRSRGRSQRPPLKQGPSARGELAARLHLAGAAGVAAGSSDCLPAEAVTALAGAPNHCNGSHGKHSAAAATGAGAGAGAAAPSAAPAGEGGRGGSDAASSGPEGDSGGPGSPAGSAGLTLEFLEGNGYFDMPLKKAASELGVGVTTLKKVCRQHNIDRWPFRKRSSLDRLISKTREYFAANPQQCREALAKLEAERASLRGNVAGDLAGPVKRFRQSVFKMEHKVRKLSAGQENQGEAVGHVQANGRKCSMRHLAGSSAAQPAEPGGDGSSGMASE